MTSNSISKQSEKTPLIGRSKSVQSEDAETETDKEGSTFGFGKLLASTTRQNRIAFYVGLLLSVVAGFVLPLTMLLQGRAAEALLRYKSTSHAADSSLTASPTNTTSRASPSAIDHLTSHLTQMTIQMVLLTAAAAVINFLSVAMVSVPAIRISNGLRRRFLDHILRADSTFHQSEKMGELSAMFHDHMERIVEALSTSASQLVMMVTVSVVLFVVAVVVNWQATLLSAFLWPLCVVVVLHLTKYMVRYTTEEQVWFGRVAALVEETFSSIRTVLSFNGQQATLDKCYEYLQKIMDISAKHRLVVGLCIGSGFWCALNAAAFTFLFGTLFLVKDDTNPEIKGQLITVGLLLTWFGLLLFTSVMPLRALLSAKVNLEAVGTVLNKKSTIDSLSDKGADPEGDDCSIRFDNVSFSYHSRSDIQVLRNVSFEVKCGEHVAFVGGSGAGKSTIANLILRFYDPTGGSVLVNERRVDTLNVRAWRHRVGYVQQGGSLFDETVAENVRYGRLDATPTQLRDAAAAAGATDFINALPEGWQTPIGESGGRLSGGQRQRVAIARAVVRRPALFIFDEATSDLDANTEQLVTQQIETLVVGRTTITIAHRLATTRNCDRIYVLQGGEIVESGTYDELMHLAGHYYRMAQVQIVGRPVKARRRFEGYSSASSLDEEGVVGDGFISGSQMSMGVGVSPKVLRRRMSSQSHSSLHSADSYSDHRIAHVEPCVGSKQLSSASSKDPPPARRRHCLRTLLADRFSRATWTNLAMAGLFNVLFVFLSTASRFCFGYMFTSLSLPTHTAMVASVVRLSIIWIIINSLTAVVNVLFVYSQCRFGDELTASLRMNLLRRVLRHGLAFFDRDGHSTGELVAVLVRDTSKLRKSILEELLYAPSMTASIVVRVAFAAWLCPSFTLLTVLVLPVDLLVVAADTAVRLHWQRRVTPLANAASKISTEAIDSLPTIHAYSLEETFGAKYADKLKGIESLYIKQALSSALVQALLQSAWPLYMAYWFGLTIYFLRHQLADAQDIWM